MNRPWFSKSNTSPYVFAKKVEFKYKMNFVAKKWLYFLKKRGIVFSIGGENIVLNRKATSEASFKRSIRINKRAISYC